MTEKATFAAGCFWGIEVTFRRTRGVLDTAVGYTGGNTENPAYQDVCAGNTGHTEAVEVIYDPDQVTYKELLNIFWDCHNPTTRDRQGPDIGTQYRSAIFYHTPEQEAEAQTSKEALQASGMLESDVVTEIKPATRFYKAEDYHQQYLEKKGRA